jgi:2-aminoadipate transaminase
MNVRLANRMTQVKPSAIRELLRHGADPSIISFGGGYPDASLFPLEQLEAVYHASIAGDGREALQYTVSNGPLKLREQIASRMRKDGITCGVPTTCWSCKAASKGWTSWPRC